MNWDAAGAIGEIAGAIAVFCSLIYLALQIRNQNEESRSLAAHQIFEGFRDSIAAVGDESIAAIFIKGNEDVGALSEVEKLRLVTLTQRLLRLWEEAYLLRCRGRLDDEIWDSMSKQYRAFLGAPSLQYVWSVRKQFYDEAFRAHVDGITPAEYSL